MLENLNERKDEKGERDTFIMNFDIIIIGFKGT